MLVDGAMYGTLYLDQVLSLLGSIIPVSLEVYNPIGRRPLGTCSQYYLPTSFCQG